MSIQPYKEEQPNVCDKKLEAATDNKENEPWGNLRIIMHVQNLLV